MSAMNRMNWAGMGGVAAFLVVGTVACSSSSNPPAAPSDAAPSEAATSSDAMSVAEEGTAVSEGGSGNVTLTVLNFLSWCSLTINGGAASTGASQTASVAAGSTVTLVVTPASSAFMIGSDPWFGVSQNDGGAAPGTDNGTGTTETSMATVVVTGNQCVSVCCQEPNMMPTPCPATNPCP